MPNHIIEGDARLTNQRTPTSHAGSHESGGSDEIDVSGLLGILADPQIPLTGGGAGTACADDDSRLSDARTPDINGLTSETTLADADTTPFYDATASAARKTTFANLRAYMARGIAQVRLSYTSTTQVTLLPRGGSLIEVNGEILDVGAGIAYATSSNLINSTGGNASATPSSSTLYYVYLSNSLASYAPSSLRLSTTAPTGLNGASTTATPDDFYLATSGNGRNWRFVGLVYTNSSAQFVNTALRRFVASYYNRLNHSLFTSPAYSDGNTASSFTSASTSWARANAGTGSTIEWLSFGDEAMSLKVRSLAGNSGAGNATRIGIGIDSTTSARVEAAHNGGTTVISIAGDFDDLTPSPGYHYAEFLVNVSAGTGTYYVDDARNGASADPYTSYLSGTVRC